MMLLYLFLYLLLVIMHNPQIPSNLNSMMFFNLEFIPYLLILYFLIFLGFNICYTSFPIHAISGLGLGSI
jgi:hypothetical protein